MWALFGYKTNDNIGDFIAERATKEELSHAKEWALKNGYVTFSYSHADGSKPDFTKVITLKG